MFQWITHKNYKTNIKYFYKIKDTDGWNIYKKIYRKIFTIKWPEIIKSLYLKPAQHSKIMNKSSADVSLYITTNNHTNMQKITKHQKSDKSRKIFDVIIHTKIFEALGIFNKK